MKLLAIILTFIVSTTFTPCGETKSNSSFKKDTIAISEVDFIKIRKKAGQLDSIPNGAKQLTDTQEIEFIERWNSSKEKGLIKAIPQYFIDIHFKDGSKRKFRIFGQYIKEQNDYSYDIGEKNFINNIWQELSTDHIGNVNRVFEDYVQYQESTDSQDDRDLMKTSLESLTALTNPKDLELLINVWLYYDPTDFPSRDLVNKVLKESRPQSIKAVTTRVDNKKDWETENSAPYSELTYLKEKLEKE